MITISPIRLESNEHKSTINTTCVSESLHEDIFFETEKEITTIL